MALMPAFKIGVWNAWIFVIPILIISFFDMRVTAARESGKSGDFQLTKKEKRIINAVFLPMGVSFIYAVFLPLRLSTTWLHSGLVIYLFGVAFSIVTVLRTRLSPRVFIVFPETPCILA